jgi:hypothetical protein
MSPTKPSLKFRHYPALGELDLQMELPTGTPQELRRANTVISELLETLRKVGWGELADSTAISEAYRDLARATERADILEKINTLQGQLERLNSPGHELDAAVARDREFQNIENQAPEGD